MSLLGQNIISINVENSSRVMRAAVPPVPTLPFICLLSVIPGNADLRVSRSQATPGAGRNRPQDANPASRSFRVCTWVPERGIQSSRISVWEVYPERLACSGTTVRESLIFMSGGPKAPQNHRPRANRPIP